MDARALAHRLEGDAYQHSREFRSLLCGEFFQTTRPTSPQQHTQLVEKWCRHFADMGLGRLGLPPSEGGDPFRFLCLGYELGLLDFNLMMRFGLQFGFVLRAVTRLGSEQQHQAWLDRITRMETSLCLAMTEVDHGSNVRGLQTEATFDPESKQLVLHTPNEGATKDYVTAAEFADVALLFGQLKSHQKSHGVHAFLVPLRSESGDLRPGITLTKCGEMGGLNGLSYSRLSFSQVSIGLDSLLNRHAHLDELGNYYCLLKSESHRFQAMLGTLVVGRSLIAAGASAGAKKCLTLALSYAARRRQFTAKAESLERTLLSYQSVQKKLMPALATLIAIDTGRSRLAQSQHEYFEDSVKDRELETFTGALKAYTSQFAVDTAQLCRQLCGGAGALQSSRLTDLRNDLDLFTTMEGDNTVLHLMVARNLVTDFRRGLDGKGLVKALGWVSKGVNLATQTGPLKSRDSSTEKLTSVEFLSQAMKFKRDRLRLSLGRRIRSRLNDGIDVFDAFNACQDHGLFLSRAYCEEKVFRTLRNVVESCPPGWDQRVLSQILNLYALSCLESDSGWYLEQGFLSSRQSKAIRDQVLELSASLAPEATKILEAFDLPLELLRSDLLEGTSN